MHLVKNKESNLSEDLAKDRLKWRKKNQAANHNIVETRL